MSTKDVEQILQKIEQWPVSEAAAAVLQSDRHIATVGDVEHRFELASVSKLLTAYAVLIAAEEGAFDIDDRVPDSVAAAFDTPPTIRELLAHAGGVGFQEPKPEKPAQERRIYSSAGYEMLADTIAETTGIPFVEYADEALNKPLGMSVDFGGSAGHGFSASVQDLIAFAKEILSPRLLSQQGLHEAMSVQFPALDGIVPGYGRQQPCPWGLGFERFGVDNSIKHPHWLGEDMPAGTAGHFGQAGTFLWVEKDSGVAAIVLTDEPFGDWAKQRWAEFNNELWKALQD